MGKIMGVLGGLIAIVIGVVGLVKWRADFIILLKGSLPILIILCGVIALIFGISEMKAQATMPESLGGTKKEP
jgi:hypothetical protein